MQTLEEVVPAVVGLLVCGVPTGWLLHLLLLSLRSRGWPSVEGRVTHSAVVPGRRNEARYDVRYAYEVEGRAYEGSRVRFAGALNMSAADARETRSRYSRGQGVRVFHHPRRPEVSTLETRVSGALWLWTALGLFMVGSIGGALLGWWE